MIAKLTKKIGKYNFQFSLTCSRSF